MTILESVLTPSSSAFKTTMVVTNAFSSGGATPISLTTGGSYRLINSGALTAGVLSSALVNIAGAAGEISICGLRTNDATARTLRLQIIADGFTCFDSTSASTANANFGILAAGVLNATDQFIQAGASISLKTSC